MLGEESRRHGRRRGFRSPFRLSRTNVSSASTIPTWAKEPNIGYKLINARSETAHQKPSFRAAFKARRCLIPADGFYEWKREGKAKQPYLIGMKDGAGFVFAGLWESWRVPDGLALTGKLSELEPGDVLETCTILTTEANATLAPIHPRMPVILPADAYDPWLAGEAVPLAPYPADAMTFHPVSTLVNKPANDDERCVEPVGGEYFGSSGLGLTDHRGGPMKSV